MTGKADWQGRTGRSWADEWRRTDRAFGALTERLLAETRGLRVTQVLDIGCGAGEVSLAIARGHPQAQVTGLDISPELLAVATERGARLANARFLLADAQDWNGEGTPPVDLVVSRHGVMFFADPAAAFVNLAHRAAPGARLAFSCFRARAESPFFTQVDALLPATPPAAPGYQPGPFGFADRRFTEAMLAAAGWQDIAFDAVDFAMIAGAGKDPVEDALAYFRRIGPAAPVLADAQESERERLLEAIRNLARSNLSGGIVSARAAAWIVTARAPGDAPRA